MLKILSGLCLLAVLEANAESESRRCVYQDERGELVAVTNPRQLSREIRERLVCDDKSVDQIAAPEDLDVGKDLRVAEFSTDLGPIKVRWSRSIERCFETNPSRAVSEAARAVNRALSNGRFTADLRHSRREWTLALIDKDRAFSQFPLALSIGRHPGFMIPPNRIYIITDYVAPSCDRQEEADDLLIQVLLHEMGHVVEYALLGQGNIDADRARAEGFAVWFEQYASDYTSALPHGQVRAYYAALARAGGATSAFTPDPQGYAAAGLRFQAIVDRRGVSGLMKVYQVIREDGVPFESAVERALSWDGDTLKRQIEEFAKREF